MDPAFENIPVMVIIALVPAAVTWGIMQQKLVALRRDLDKLEIEFDQHEDESTIVRTGLAVLEEKSEALREQLKDFREEVLAALKRS